MPDLKRVLIVEHDKVLSDLLVAILHGEACEVQTVDQISDAMNAAKRYHPDLLIVDLLPTKPDEEIYTLLDQLRLDRTTRRIPIMAMSTSSNVAEAALASYNVRTTLVKPFDLADLHSGIREALGRPPLHAEIPVVPPRGVLLQAELLLAQYSRHAIVRWVQILQSQPPWKDRRDLQLHDFIDHIPVLVEAINAVFSYGDLDELFEKNPRVAERVSDHTRLRSSQGIGLDSVVREYTLLRDELWNAILGHWSGVVHPADFCSLQRVVNRTTDRLIEITTRICMQDLSRR